MAALCSVAAAPPSMFNASLWMPCFETNISFPILLVAVAAIEKLLLGPWFLPWSSWLLPWHLWTGGGTDANITVTTVCHFCFFSWTWFRLDAGPFCHRSIDCLAEFHLGSSAASWVRELLRSHSDSGDCLVYDNDTAAHCRERDGEEEGSATGSCWHGRRL